MKAKKPATAILCCRVLENEVRHFARGLDHIVSVDFFEMGLHDIPSKLNKTLSHAIEEVEKANQAEVIALVYALCGTGTLHLHTKRCQIVIPRAHDCITLFMGAKERYAQQLKENPGAYFYTPGWNKGKKMPGPDRFEQLRKEYEGKFDEDQIEDLLEIEREQLQHHHCAVYLDLGVGDIAQEEAYAQNCAKWMGWNFKHLKGDPSLLEDLLAGNWDSERFLVLPPGSAIGASNDETIFKSTDPSPRT